MTTVALVIIALVILGGAVAAVSLRNLVHCALCLVAVFVGVAALFLALDAQFVGLAQLLVYVGAVAILIVFAILLTRGGEVPGGVAAPAWTVGGLVALLTAGALVAAVAQSKVAHQPDVKAPAASVKAIGEKLMTDYVLPLEVVALLLTAALIGAALIALQERKPRS